VPDFRLSAQERLKSRKRLALLFSEGKSVGVFPLRCLWLVAPRDGRFPARVSFSVSKRLWKRAIDRNRIKRRMREAYRLHKHQLYRIPLVDDQQILVICLFTATKHYPFDQISAAMSIALKKIAVRYSEKDTK
jgi:ribonuclease P protein component